jgi:Zn-dependent protease/CBS domain-containing protein
MKENKALQNDTEHGVVSGISLGSLFGVRILLHWSLLIIFGLIVFNLGVGVFPRWHPEWSAGLNWLVATSAAVLFFASILIHELSHAVAGRAQGIPVRKITLFLFGGMAHAEGGPRSPKAEFVMAIVGPLTSAVIGIVSLVAGFALAGSAFDPGLLETNAGFFAALRQVGPVPTLLLWLGPINIVLAIFNMIPGFPLDGGRVLRAILWSATRDLNKATRWAAGVGQAVGVALMVFGVMNLFSGVLTQGIWLILLGWFLSNAARASSFHTRASSALETVPVSRVMRTNLTSVDPDMSVEAFVRDRLMTGDETAFPVERAARVLGIVSEEDVRRLPSSRWTNETVRDIMKPLEGLTTLSPQAPASEALEKLMREDVAQLPIVEQDHLFGVVRRQDLMRWLSFQHLRAQH